MGNSATREQGAGRGSSRHGSSEQTGASTGQNERAGHTQNTSTVYHTRAGRSSRPDLSSLLNMVGSGDRDRDVASLEHRRESKAEKEARRSERERVNRLKERERSMREEHVDGGYLVTQGVYTGVEDYGKTVVRQLMIERRLAPFWRGLNDHSDSWTEHQLVAVAQGRRLPAPDEIPSEDITDTSKVNEEPSTSRLLAPPTETLAVPILSTRAQSYTTEPPSSFPAAPNRLPRGSPETSETIPSSLPSMPRIRSKTVASLTDASRSPAPEMTPREIQLPKDPYVNGQRLEAHLYKDASECPICFLYYPAYLNRTRCCDQPICTECFVQIKRPDPHPPEHATDPAGLPVEASPAPPETEAELVSEPAQCPYCNQTQFGVTYEAPPFRRGLSYATQPSLQAGVSAMSSTSSLASGHSGPDRLHSHRRNISMSATDPSVITTDRVRPEWHQKLEAARAHAARRSAAASALHAAAYVGRGEGGDARSFAGFGRRGLLRRTSGGDAAHMNMLALMSERYAAQSGGRSQEANEAETSGENHAQGSSRRRRVDDLEEMMMMEAIRLSLAAEDDRKRKEEKEAKKDAKKKDKENKKAEKLARKAGAGASTSTLTLNSIDGPDQSASSSRTDLGKGKSAQPNVQEDWPMSNNTNIPHRPSHLRTLSNASDSTSSMKDGTTQSMHANASVGLDGNLESTITAESGASSGQGHLLPQPSSTGVGLAPLNFSSLAAMIGSDGGQENPPGENDSTKERNPAGAGPAESSHTTTKP